jgi:peptidoglycan/LPS O-acetylase OafA/YrhL
MSNTDVVAGDFVTSGIEVSMNTPQPITRNQSLDALRGVAILLVLGRHEHYYALWHRIGWVGVPLFFVLSGFLVSGLLFDSYKESGQLHIRRFILRRGLKIWPGFYVLLFFTLALYRSASGSMSWRDMGMFAFFLQNYAHHGLGYLGHTWSLAIEEHFYLLLPLLLFLLVKLYPAEPFSVIPKISVFCIVTCLMLRYFTTHLEESIGTTHLRIDGLFAGVTLAYWFHFRQDVFTYFTRSWSLLVGGLICSPVFCVEDSSRMMQTIGITMLLFGFSFVTAWTVSRTPRNYIFQKFCTALAKVGYYSYSIYLWHFILGVSLYWLFPHSALAFWVYVFLAIAVGIVMAEAIEIPFLRLREKLVPKTPRSKNEAIVNTEIPLAPT